MAAKEKITKDRLNSVLSYDPETGIFVWRERPLSDFCEMVFPENGRAVWNAKRTGKNAGTVCRGYVVIRFEGVRYLAHRLAWFCTHGEWPSYDLGHKDGDRGNNRLSNLQRKVFEKPSRLPWKDLSPEEAEANWLAWGRDRAKLHRARRHAICPETLKANSARWYKRNSEKVKAAKAVYRALNREKIAEARARYVRNNKDIINRCGHKRRVLQRASAEHYTLDELKTLREKCGSKCGACGKKKVLTVDHIVPLSRGGSNSIRNIQFRLIVIRC